MRPKLPSVQAEKKAPSPLRVPGAGITPRAPRVGSSPDLPDASPSSPALTEVTAGMSTIAIEAALAELTAWRREAERKIARLEAEVADLSGNDIATKVDAIPGVAFAAGAIPSPSHAQAHAKEGPAPWAPAAAVAVAAPAPVPVAPLVHAVPIAAHTPHPAVAPPPAPSSAPALAAVPIAVGSAPVVHQAQHAPAFREVRPQYDLTMKPGESIDLPSGLDGGRRKKTMGMIAALLLIAGMAALVISALASQR